MLPLRLLRELELRNPGGNHSRKGEQRNRDAIPASPRTEWAHSPSAFNLDMISSLALAARSRMSSLISLNSE